MPTATIFPRFSTRFSAPVEAPTTTALITAPRLTLFPLRVPPAAAAAAPVWAAADAPPARVPPAALPAAGVMSTIPFPAVRPAAWVAGAVVAVAAVAVAVVVAAWAAAGAWAAARAARAARATVQA